MFLFVRSTRQKPRAGEAKNFRQEIYSLTMSFQKSNDAQQDGFLVCDGESFPLELVDATNKERMVGTGIMDTLNFEKAVGEALHKKFKKNYSDLTTILVINTLHCSGFENNIRESLFSSIEADRFRAVYAVYPTSETMILKVIKQF